MGLKKVTMSLSERDLEKAKALVERLHSRNRAAAVSTALAIAEELTRWMAQGDELMLKRKDGTLDKVWIAGL